MPNLPAAAKPKTRTVTCLRCGRPFKSELGRVSKRPVFHICAACKTNPLPSQRFGDVWG